MPVELILIFLIIILLLILSMVWPPDSPWSPWWRTSKETALLMCRLAKVNKDDIIYDLGSGDGRVLIVAAREFGAKGVGIEIDPLRVFISTLMIRIIRVSDSDKVTIRWKNFFEEDLSGATVVFLYLIPKTLDRLLPKLKKELKKGTRIVSYKYEMRLPLIKYDKENNLRMYKI